MIIIQVKEYFSNNTHYVVQTMTPKDGYTEENQAVVDEVERKLISQLSDEDKKQVVETGKQLLEQQMQKASEESMACLPTLTIGDIAANAPNYDLNDYNFNQSGLTKGIVTNQPTNGVAFFRAIMDTSDIEDNKYYSMFVSLLTSMGAGSKYDYRQLETQMDLYTGGLSTAHHMAENPAELKQLVNKGLLISSYALERNTEKMFELWNDIFQNVFSSTDDLKERLTTLIKMSATDSMNGLAYSGHHYAMTHAASKLTELPATKIRERDGGLSSVRFVNKLAMSINNGNEDLVGEILREMATMSRLVLNEDRFESVMTNTSPDHGQTFVKQTEQFLRNLPSVSNRVDKGNDDGTANRVPLKTFIATPFPVHFCGKAVPTVPYEHQDSAPLRVLAKLVSSKYLHAQIREKGGAYGGGATSNPSSGVFSFYSYRDPNCTQTLEAFDSSTDWMLNPDNFSQRDIDEAKLGIFQAVDKPALPGQRGLRWFLSGISHDTFQQHRQRLRNVAREDLERVARAYLTNANAGVSVMGPETTAKTLDSSWAVQNLLG